MFNKLYTKIKEIGKKNYKFLISFFALLILFTIEFPYYINAPGGIINISSKIDIENSYKVKGSFNLSYVSELKATIPTLIYAYFNPNWDILKEKDVVIDNETYIDSVTRNQIMLEESESNAIKIGYSKAKKNIFINFSSIYVTYIDELSNTTLKIGDKIISVNGINITSKTDLYNIISSKKEGEFLNIKVIREDKEVDATATTMLLDKRIVIGIMASQIDNINTDPDINFKFTKSESGPSGGLMLALSIYNLLTEEDITKGKTIVGTGTIEADESVGSIGGIEYKIKGAVKSKADIFLVPYGENYEDAKKLIEEKQYSIKLIPVSTFDDALQKLKDYNN